MLVPRISIESLSELDWRTVTHQRTAACCNEWQGHYQAIHMAVSPSSFMPVPRIKFSALTFLIHKFSYSQSLSRVRSGLAPILPDAP